MNTEKRYQWRIEIEQHLPSFKIDQRFENRIISENHLPRFISMTLELTAEELDDFMATIKTGFEYRLMSVTNMSECLVMAVRQTKDVVKLHLLDGSLRELWAPMEIFATILKSENDVRRMNANFDRDETFRAWIDQSDWNHLLDHESADRLKYTFAE